jgi:hypothetical protein
MLEKILPRNETPETHPVQECPALPLERRVQLLEIHLAQLWDEVWWHQLPFHRRLYYRLQGFRSPIRQFYLEGKGADITGTGTGE